MREYFGADNKDWNRWGSAHLFKDCTNLVRSRLDFVPRVLQGPDMEFKLHSSNIVLIGIGGQPIRDANYIFVRLSDNRSHPVCVNCLKRAKEDCRAAHRRR